MAALSTATYGTTPDTTMDAPETVALISIDMNVSHLDGSVAELHVSPGGHIVTAEIRIPGPA